MSTLRSPAASSDLTDLDLFQLPSQDQKAQLWGTVPVELRQSTHELKGQSA